MNTNTQILLEGLKGEGISVTVGSLAKYMASSGVLVRPFVGRASGRIPLSSKIYGIDLEQFTEAGSSFYKSRVTQGYINFVPKEDEAALSTLEQRLRRAVERKSLAEDFMPMSAYDSLKEEFEEIRREYFRKRDEIIDKWGTLVTQFMDGAQEMLDGIRLPDTMRTQFLGEFRNQIPHMNRYRDSFKMTLRVHAFPAEGNIPEGLNGSVEADLKETWEEDVVTTAILSIEKQVGLGWSRCTSGIRQYISGGGIHARTLAAIENFAQELTWKNVFHNPILSQLQTILKGFSGMSTDEQATAIEEGAFLIYGYAKNTGLHLSMKDCPYTKEQLEAELCVRNITELAS